jgi:putative flippase GtrA
MTRLYRFIRLHRLSITLFLLVGICSICIYFLTFSLLWKYFGFHYQIAVTIAYFLTVVIHFTANRQVTFKSKDKKLTQQICRYSITTTINYFITLIIIHTSVKQLHYSPYIGIIAAISITLGFGFLMARFWIFPTRANS